MYAVFVSNAAIAEFTDERMSEYMVTPRIMVRMENAISQFVVALMSP